MSPNATLPMLSNRHLRNPEPSAPLWDDSRYIPSLSPFYSSQIDLNQQDSTISQQHVYNPKLPSKSTYSSKSDNFEECKGADCIQAEDREPLRSSRISNTTSPFGNSNQLLTMKTLHKVVKVSKSCTKHMRERLASVRVDGMAGGPTYIEDLEQRILILEQENNSLKEDVLELQRENKRLRQKSKSRNSYKGKECSQSDSDSCSYPSSTCNSNFETGIGSEDCLNNSLMQHIALLNRPDDSRWNRQHFPESRIGKKIQGRGMKKYLENHI
jgi:hypothetical protein